MMDLIGELCVELKLKRVDAQGLAAQIISVVEETLHEAESVELARSVGDAVPELYEWRTSASPTLTPGAMALSEVPPGTMLPPQTPERQLQGLLTRFKVDAGKAGVVGALVRRFLAGRMSEQAVARLAQSVPFLA